MKKFNRHTDTLDLTAMGRLCTLMSRNLDDLRSGGIPNAYDFTEAELLEYARSLVDGQYTVEGNYGVGHWSILPANEKHAPSEAVIDFVYKPTYLAIATLTLVRLNWPVIAGQIPGLDDCLLLGMRFISQYDFPGHGFDALYDRIDALTILLKGKVHRLLIAEPSFCPPLKKLIETHIGDFRVKLQDGTTTGAWNENYAESFKTVIGLFEQD